MGQASIKRSGELAIQMKFCRIDLSKTNYNLLENTRLLIPVERINLYPRFLEIYKQYCEYKNFDSVMPLFKSEIIRNWVIAYYDQNDITAFSIIKFLDHTSVESSQFAWDYKNPGLRLGIKSIEHECAHYKRIGKKYLYLGEVAEYKTQFDGYEQIGN
jgi:hypothetical protein